MRNSCCILALVFFVATGLLAYRILWQGEVVPASDGRTSILLSPGERDLVLGEMRAFLQATQQILSATSQGSMDGVVEAARGVGAVAQQGVPPSLMGKIPGEFKLLGFDTHSKFDLLAVDAEQLGDPTHSLQQLAELTRNCVACHAVYRIETIGR